VPAVATEARDAATIRVHLDGKGTHRTWVSTAPCIGRGPKFRVVGRERVSEPFTLADGEELDVHASGRG
jgi:hypothetical protein